MTVIGCPQTQTQIQTQTQNRTWTLTWKQTQTQTGTGTWAWTWIQEQSQIQTLSMTQHWTETQTKTWTQTIEDTEMQIWTNTRTEFLPRVLPDIVPFGSAALLNGNATLNGRISGQGYRYPYVAFGRLVFSKLPFMNFCVSSFLSSLRIYSMYSIACEDFFIFLSLFKGGILSGFRKGGKPVYFQMFPIQMIFAVKNE